MRERLVPLTVLAALLLLGVQAPLAADTLTETFEETYEVAAGTRVSLRNTNGSVSIETWSQNSVRIVAEKRVRTRDEEHAREAIEAIEIIVTERDGRLEIETEYPRESTGMFSWLFGRDVDASVRYELRVPASVELDVVTVNGSVSSDGPQGEQRLRSTNGRINVEGAGGSVEARTTNGSVKVEVEDGEAEMDIDIATTNGSITLYIPADFQGRLEARTVNGSVRTDLPVTLKGNISKRRMDAELNGGGAAHIGLRTTNGSIRIQKS